MHVKGLVYGQEIRLKQWCLWSLAAVLVRLVSISDWQGRPTSEMT